MTAILTVFKTIQEHLKMAYGGNVLLFIRQK